MRQKQDIISSGFQMLWSYSKRVNFSVIGLSHAINQLPIYSRLDQKLYILPLVAGGLDSGNTVE